MPTLQVGGATIAYSDSGAPAGRPDAPTIVFGHGLLFSGWMFHPQIDVLRSRYRCVAIDWRGQGDSPPARRGYDMDTLTADAVAVISAVAHVARHESGSRAAVRASQGSRDGCGVSARRRASAAQCRVARDVPADVSH